jgi:retron-type reverse transcriptase
MAQQKSEDRVVPDGGVMPVQPDVEDGGQGKAVPVEQTAVQLRLPIATAEDPAGSAREVVRDRSRAGRTRVPKAIVTEGNSPLAMMEEVVWRLDSAMKKVVANKGAPGPDGMTVGELREQWPTIAPKLRAALLAGSYRPGGIRRAMIPKAGGGQRGLGIPGVVDRVVMEAVRQALEPLFEPSFHSSSHGFRPGRSCHTAIAEAKGHVRQGYEWVVDIDLEKFFDRVNHQRLTARLAQRVTDRRLLVLIGRMLKAKVVLPDGVVIGVDEGVPQGSPLSPLLSNIVLDELDTELARRGHRFVRYADLCGSPHRSAYAESRVMPRTRWIASGCGVHGRSPRHNQSASRNASRWSGGWYRPGVLLGGVVRASARSLIAMSAWR